MKIVRNTNNTLNEEIRFVKENVPIESMNIAKISKQFGISRQTIYKWLALDDYENLRIKDIEKLMNILGYELKLQFEKKDDE